MAKKPFRTLLFASVHVGAYVGLCLVAAAAHAGENENMGTARLPERENPGMGTAPLPQEALKGEEPSLYAPTVRFVALGDGGEGNQAQYQVADAVGYVCARDGCDFALYLGDNFYDDGVSSLDDEQFRSKFEQPYANLDMPFYVALGNHDYGDDEGWKAELQVAYTDHSSKWTMFDRFYAFSFAHATFFALDTTPILNGEQGEQGRWLDERLQDSGGMWRIAFGHHPYMGGDRVEEFIDRHVCGAVDVYFAGHAHSRQWLEPTCGTQFVISGAASKVSTRHHYNIGARFVDTTIEGFVWVQIRGTTFEAVFYDKNAGEQFRARLSK